MKTYQAPIAQAVEKTLAHVLILIATSEHAIDHGWTRLAPRLICGLASRSLLLTKGRQQIHDSP
jgi:hypothetical protein